MREAARIRQISNKAYAGTSGAERRRFCRAYRETLTRLYAKTWKAFTAELALKGEKVSCAKGCSFCCAQHISAPAAHAIAVVDFLYANEPVLSRFLRNYGPWEEAAGGLSRELDAVYNAAMDPAESGQAARGKVLACEYLSRRIPCPFLVKSACSIYAVRPVCCASHCSVSPPEWCVAGDTHDLCTYEATPSGGDLRELVRLAPLRLSLYHATLPLMVYRLLTEDFSGIMTEIDSQFS